MPDETRNYATLLFIVRYGNLAAVALVAAVLAAFLALYIFHAMPGWTLGVAVAGLAVIYGLLRSYVEIVQVICETLLPR